LALLKNASTRKHRKYNSNSGAFESFEGILMLLLIFQLLIILSVGNTQTKLADGKPALMGDRKAE
jgi:hypothetical protein